MRMMNVMHPNLSGCGRRTLNLSESRWSALSPTRLKRFADKPLHLVLKFNQPRK
jgi:hypothetical protein